MMEKTLTIMSQFDQENETPLVFLSFLFFLNLIFSPKLHHFTIGYAFWENMIEESLQIISQLFLAFPKESAC